MEVSTLPAASFKELAASLILFVLPVRAVLRVKTRVLLLRDTVSPVPRGAKVVPSAAKVTASLRLAVLATRFSEKVRVTILLVPLIVVLL